MTLLPEELATIPEETARVARAAFPNGNRYLLLRDTFGQLFTDADFVDLFPDRGRPVVSPWRLAAVTVFQFAEGLPDRQAAESVRARLDWKYALGLTLEDAGFDFTVLSEFRSRVLAGAAEQRLLEVILAHARQQGYLSERGTQRTDATHVLGLLRTLNRLERLAETLRATLNAIAAVAPAWLREHSQPDWVARYDRRVEEYRLPKSQAARAAYGVQLGVDGHALLAAVGRADTPAAVQAVVLVETLRQMWVQQFVLVDEQVKLREVRDLPPSGQQVVSPYEQEARLASKRQLTWPGYKVHLTEQVAAELPQLITEVTTTAATVSDGEQLAPIQQRLADAARAPGKQVVDSGYISGETLVHSQQAHGITLIGPINTNNKWQATQATGYDQQQFAIDWESQTVQCPQGCQSKRWYASQSPTGKPVIRVDFAATDCTPCPVRGLCTRAAKGPRRLTLRCQAEHEAIAAARQRQGTDEFVQLYAVRAGIEGTLSQGVRVFGLRQARYRGLAKTHLQHLATGSAINLSRIFAFIRGKPRATTRRSRYAAVMAAA